MIGIAEVCFYEHGKANGLEEGKRLAWKSFFTHCEYFKQFPSGYRCYHPVYRNKIYGGCDKNCPVLKEVK